MGHEVPYKPDHHLGDKVCATCKWSAPIPKSHWQHQYHQLFCHRFPPTPPSSAVGVGPWNMVAVVRDKDFCGEFKREELP